MTALGVILIAAALVALVAEAHLSRGGLIGAFAGAAAIGGIAVLLVGAGADAVAVVIVTFCAAVAAITLLWAFRRRILRPLRSRPHTGQEGLVGHLGVVRAAGGPQAQVFVDGSLWRAEPDPVHQEAELHDGDRVVIERVNGLTLRVRKAEEWELQQ
jgi:membrane-bound serine protease (ClpP class)